MFSYHVTYINSDPARTQADAKVQQIEIVARAMAQTDSYVDNWESISEPDRAYWRRKARTAIQVIKDLTP